MDRVDESVRNPAQAEHGSPSFMSESVPRYYQIGSLLREKIVSGQLAPGDRIATEGELAREYGVSRVTVRHALECLKEDRLVRREPGRRRFVIAHSPPTESLRVDGSLDDLISMGVQTSVRLLELAVVQATAEQARLLEIPTGTPVVRSIRLRLHHEEPFSYIVTVLPEKLGQRIERDDWTRGSILKLLTEKLDVPIGYADQTVRASLADASLARALDVRFASPLLWVSRVVKRTDGRPVKSVSTYYRSDIYSFRVHLVRAEQANGSGKEWSLGGLAHGDSSSSDQPLIGSVS
jgi:GntR family transcriptional regulator